MKLSPSWMPSCSRLIQSASLSIIGLLATASISQAVTVTWTGAVDNNYNTTGNWSGGAVPLGSNQVLIDGNYTVIRSAGIAQNSSDLPSGSIVNAFTISGGATLNNSSGLGSAGGRSFRIYSTSTVTNNVLIDTGSTLITDRFWMGNNPGDATSALSLKVTTATIKGTVIAERDFVGYRPQGSNATEGGYIVHIDGGSFATPVSSIGFSGNVTNPNLTAHFLISNGGYLDLGTVNANWTASAIHYVEFLDTTGSLVFNKSGNWSNLSGVQALIDDGFIRAAGGETFNIIDNGSSWLVSVPEPSTYALMIGGALLILVGVRHRLRG